MSAAARRLSLLVPALALLAGAALALTPHTAQADHPAWSATLTVQEIATGQFGCRDQNSMSSERCATAVTDRDFTIGGTRYVVESINLSGGTMTIVLDSPLPDETKGWSVVIGGRTFTVTDGGQDTIFLLGTGLTWAAGDSISLSLRRSLEYDLAEDIRTRGGSRSEARCRGLSDNDPDASAKFGLWHCHGLLVHQHAQPNWSARHVVTSTSPVPRLTNEQPDATKNPGGHVFHWHGREIFHGHSEATSGHRHDRELRKNIGGTPVPAGSVHRPVNDQGVADPPWHWHGDDQYHSHPTGQHPHRSISEIPVPREQACSPPPLTAEQRALGFGPWHCHPDLVHDGRQFPHQHAPGGHPH